MEKKKTSKLSAGFVLGAGCLWGCMGILVKTMSKGGFTSIEVTAFRSLITSLCMFIGLGIWNREALQIKLKDLWCFLGTGILSVVFFNVCYFSCMTYTTLSTAAILLYTAPVFVMVMSFFLFKEKLTVKKVAALLLAFTGCILVSGGLGKSGISPLGLLYGLGAGLGYALYSIFSRYAILRGYGSYTITAYTFLFATLGCIPFLRFAHLGVCLREAALTLPFAAGMAFLTTVAAYILYTKGLQGMENGKASIVASIEPVVASLVGFLLYNEVPSVMGIGGMVLVLSACALMA